jgi:hypothetical protein
VPSTAVVSVTPKIFYEKASERVLVVGNCVIVLIASTLSLEAVGAIERAFEEITKRNEWIVYFSQITRGEKSDTLAQDKMAKVVARYTKQIAGAAIVYRGSGFRATAVRSLITAVHWTSRASHPMKVFDDVGSALIWLKHQAHAESTDVNLLRGAVRTAGA